MVKFKYFGRYRLLLILSLLSWVSISIAQNAGDFRTKKSGLWDSPTTWELYDGSTWRDSISVTPGQNDNVYIQNNHSVTLTKNESCKNLNLHTGDNQNRITTSSYSLSIFGKLRAYTGNVPGISTTALPITENWINTSGGGRILIEGNSRNITEAGEWGMNPVGWRMEIALNPGETGIFNTGVKAAHFIISSGTVILTLDNTFRPDSGVYGSGTITIQSGATLRLKAGSLQRLLFAGPNAHFARLDVNGTLAFDSSVVGAIGAAVINFNGKVIYSANGAQTFLTRGANSNGAHPNVYTDVELNGTGVKTLGLNTTINGTLRIAGESGFSLGSYSLTYGGGSTVEYAGSIAQTTSNAELPASGGAPNLTIDNINGVTLHDSRTVMGNLTLSNGTIITGLNTLTIAGTGSVTRNNGHVAGKLEKQVPTGSPVLSYEIGDLNNYTPVYLAFNGVTTGGSVTAEVVNGDHPEIEKSKINKDKSVNRYWTIGNNGVSFSTSDAVFNFVGSDIDNGADTDKFIVEKYDAPNWTSVNVGTRTATSTAVTGITSFSEFAIGEIKKYTITATAGSNGIITPSGDVEVTYGENQQFIFTPNAGYHVSSVLVDGFSVDSLSSYTFYNVDANHTILVNFAINTYTLTLNAVNGNIIKNPDLPLYNYGTPVELTAIPDEGYHFVNWSGDTTGTANPIIIVINNSKSITANFSINVYNIIATAGPNGSINPDGVIPVNYGGNQSFTIFADAGYSIDTVFVDNIPIGNVSFYEFTNVNSDHTIHALFKTSVVNVNIQINSGWNLISVPVVTNDFRKESLFPTAQSDAFAYAGIYEIRDTLKNGEGYWLKFNEPQSVLVSGIKLEYDTIDVRQGWNIIGSLTKNIPTASVNPLGVNIESNFFTFNNGYQITDSVKGGQGVWVKVTDSGKMLLSETNLNKSISWNPDKLNEDFSKLTISTPSGNHQILYFGKKSEGYFNQNRFELPPVPPAEIFDVRFGDNNFIIIYDTPIKNRYEYPIRIQSTQWPVSLEWEVEKENGVDYILEYSNGGKVKRIYLKNGTTSVKIAKHEASNVLLKIIPLELPENYVLEQNYPNPFNPSTVIRFGLPEQSIVSLKVYDMLGREITTLIDNEIINGGYSEIEFANRDMSAGVYFFRLEAHTLNADHSGGSGYSAIRKMVYLK